MKPVLRSVAAVAAIMTVLAGCASRGGSSVDLTAGQLAIEARGVSKTFRIPTHRISRLKERLAVIERITVEKENSLERQIEELRDR